MRIPRKIKTKIEFLQHWTRDEFDHYWSFSKPESGVYPSFLGMKIKPLELRFATWKEWILDKNEKESYEVDFQFGISILGIGVDIYFEITFL